jgi:hypothetical protein
MVARPIGVDSIPSNPSSARRAIVSRRLNLALRFH